MLYTSAPHGLRPGTAGFCTVAMTRGLSPNLAEKVESLAAYRRIAGGDARSEPINFGHWVLADRGLSVHVLLRVGPAPADYTGRANKFGHFILLAPNELAPAGPAWLLAQPGLFEKSWQGEPRWIATGRTIPMSGLSAKRCEYWHKVAGDAGWGGVVAAHVVSKPNVPCYIVCRPDVDLLGLIGEALALLTVEQRWAIAFSTFFQGLPFAGAACHIRGVPLAQGSAADADLGRGMIVDLTTPRGTAPDGPLVNAARTGKLPAAAESLALARASREEGEIGLAEPPDDRGRAADDTSSRPYDLKPGAERISKPQETWRINHPSAAAMPATLQSKWKRQLLWMIPAAVILIAITVLLVITLAKPDHLAQQAQVAAGPKVPPPVAKPKAVPQSTPKPLPPATATAPAPATNTTKGSSPPQTKPSKGHKPRAEPRPKVAAIPKAPPHGCKVIFSWPKRLPLSKSGFGSLTSRASVPIIPIPKHVMIFRVNLPPGAGATFRPVYAPKGLKTPPGPWRPWANLKQILLKFPAEKPVAGFGAIEPTPPGVFTLRKTKTGDLASSIQGELSHLSGITIDFYSRKSHSTITRLQFRKPRSIPKDIETTHFALPIEEAVPQWIRAQSILGTDWSIKPPARGNKPSPRRAIFLWHALKPPHFKIQFSLVLRGKTLRCGYSTERQRLKNKLAKLRKRSPASLGRGDKATEQTLKKLQKELIAAKKKQRKHMIDDEIKNLTEIKRLETEERALKALKSVTVYLCPYKNGPVLFKITLSNQASKGKGK